uniref:Putative glutamine cyclotransferase n=1 Tax=uncultured Acidobacteriota bacterium TaxID=171953 RepID=Q7X2U3_9BACT|nr:putative glutamine cyclotransferase [uncultured Acidobacteriota bacterium]
MAKLFLSSFRTALKTTALFLILFLSLATLNCQTPGPKATTNDRTPVYGYEVVHTFPHDPDAFTQGLEFHDGNFLESTGEVGHSSLRRVEIETGKVLQRVEVPRPYFAEGITLLRGKIYQLTWQHQLGFVYDALTFEKNGQFNYTGEGWGLTNDGQSLILSDGSNRIRFINPDNFQVQRTIVVLDADTPVREINELEYVKGEIYANIWHANRIARIDPQTGKVVGWIDLTGLLAPGEVQDEEAVLNGIAFDAAGDRLFVTGKLWPKIFEIRVTKK